MDQVLLFDRTKHGADRIVKELKKQNISGCCQFMAIKRKTKGRKL